MAVSMDLPATQRAIVANDELDYSIQDDVSLPPLSPDSVIIRTSHVGLNPVDTKMVGPFVGAGATYGVDCAGEIVALGADISASRRLELGDRVAGCADGMEAVRPRSGAFAEYSSVHGDMVFKLPEGMSFAVGAGMPLRIATAALALFHSLGLPSELLDEKQTKGGESFDVLVYGGATSTGTMAIQLLKICGLRVITTCSPKNFELVRGYGADECVDYHSPTCGPDIRAMTKNELDYALDCVTNEGTMKICYQALGRCGGKYVALEPYPDTATTRQAVRPDWILVTWMRGLPISWPAPFGTETAKPGYQAFGREVMPKLHRLFEEGKLSSHPIREEKDGFEGLLDGVDLLRKGKVRGEKLVYRTQERRCVVSAAA